MTQANLMQELSSGLLFADDFGFEQHKPPLASVTPMLSIGSEEPQQPPQKKLKINMDKPKTIPRNVLVGLKQMVKFQLTNGSQDHLEFLYNILGKMDSILERGGTPSVHNFYQDLHKMRVQIEKITTEKPTNEDAMKYLQEAQGKFLTQMMAARARLREDI